MSKFKILIIPSSYSEDKRTTGGGERYACEYARALNRLTPTVLGLLGSQERLQEDQGLPVRVFTNKGFSSQWPFTILSKAASCFLDFDIFHIMVFPTPFTDFLILIALLHGKKVVLTDVGGGGTCLSTRFGRIWKKLNLNCHVHGMAHLTEYASLPYRHQSCQQVVLRGGVSSSAFNEMCSGFMGGYALFVGRLLPHKGALELIKALAPATPLRVVGTIADMPYYRKLVDEARGKNVSFHTDCDDISLREHYRGCSVVVQPSLPSTCHGFDKSELLGLVALEGMSWGKPVVVTRVAALPEVSVDGVTGAVVEPYDLLALRNAVEQFVYNQDLSEKIGLSAKNRAVQLFSWDKAAESGMKLYSELIKK